MIPYKSKLPKNKSLDKRNKKYKSLSKKDRVREIGLDILESYNAGLLEEQDDSQYWPRDLYEHFKELTDPKEFQTELYEKEKEILCSVCARGAIMVSRIKLGNEIGGDMEGFCDGEGNDGESIVKEFEMEDLNDMEATYESYGFLRYEERTPECIAAIAANLVANGKWNDSDETDYLKKWRVRIKNKHAVLDEATA